MTAGFAAAPVLLVPVPAVADAAPVFVPFGGWRCAPAPVPLLAPFAFVVPLVPALPVPVEPLIPPLMSVPPALLPFMPFVVLLLARVPLVAVERAAAT